MLTTNRVEKGNSATFAPKINARNRQRKPAADAKRTEPAVLVEEPAAPVELEIPAVEVEQPVAVIPQPALIAAPRAAQDAPTATMIRPPTAPIEAPVEPVVATATEPFNEEFSQISDFSISKLISTKFNRGQLSKAEELHLESKQLRNSPGAELIKAPSRPPTPVLPADVPTLVPAPQFRMVNGVMQIDQSSLQIVQQYDSLQDMQRIDEDVVRRVTSSSFSTRHKSKRVKWNQVETLKFYDGLSYFGTDFGMISLMFPGLDRKQLKLKFHAEERIRPDLITKALKTVKKPSEELRSLMRAALPEPKSTNKPKQSPLAPPASSTNTNETPEHPELSMEPNTQETLVDTDCIIATAAVEQVLEPIVSDAVQEKINNTLAARSTSTQLTNSALKTAPVIPTRRRKRPAESTAVELPIETPFAAEQ